MTTNKDEFSLCVSNRIENNPEELSVLEIIEQLRKEFGYERKQVKKLLTNNIIEIVRTECEAIHLLERSNNTDIKGFFT